MEELTLTTPALLFSAISLIMLAYTNRFLAYASIIRNLHDKYQKEKKSVLIAQIKNIKHRLYLTRSMQMLGINSLLLCVLTMFLIYIQLHIIAVWVFGLALILLIFSLASMTQAPAPSEKIIEFLSCWSITLDKVSVPITKHFFAIPDLI